MVSTGYELMNEASPSSPHSPCWCIQRAERITWYTWYQQVLTSLWFAVRAVTQCADSLLSANRSVLTPFSPPIAAMDSDSVARWVNYQLPYYFIGRSLRVTCIKRSRISHNGKCHKCLRTLTYCQLGLSSNFGQQDMENNWNCGIFNWENIIIWIIYIHFKVMLIFY